MNVMNVMNAKIGTSNSHHVNIHPWLKVVGKILGSGWGRSSNTFRGNPEPIYKFRGNVPIIDPQTQMMMT
jgi:hypothetical protein